MPASGSRSALSLLELLVVLTILIALGGIVVSTLPGMLERTQVATAAANIPEIDATLRRTAMLSNGQIGNRFDALVTGSSGLDGDIPEYVGGFENFETMTLSQPQLDGLESIGIDELVPALETTTNATFASHDQQPVVIDTNSKICRLRPDVAQTLLREDWNLEPEVGASYLVFGLGEQSTLVGAGSNAAFSEPPIHFSDNRLQSPELMYSRYLLIVELQSMSDSSFTARYVGAAIPGRKGIQNVSKELEAHYTKTMINN